MVRCSLDERGAHGGYDDWGNLLHRQESAGSAKHYSFDSADRLRCIGTTPGGCEILEVVYDSQGMRVREETGAGGPSRHFQGDGYSITLLASGDTEYRTEVFAFGERVGFLSTLLEAEAGLPNGVGPAPPLGLVLLVPAGALLLAILSLGTSRRESLLLIAERPGTACLALLLSTCLAVPFPVAAGGGGRVTSYRWVLSDPIGSGILVLDENGDLVRHTRFKPFGALDEESPPTSGERRYYAGHPQQEETGLSYMKARWMDPESGTFLSVDPLIVPSDPQSANAYTYARNNPIRFNDPTGQNWQEAFAAAAQQFAEQWGNAFRQTVSDAITDMYGPPSGGSSGGGASDLGGGGAAGSGAGAGGGGVVLAQANPQPQGNQSGQSGSNTVVIDSTPEAVTHYFTDDTGDPVALGPETQDAIKNSPDQQSRAERIRTGQTSNIYRGNYGVDVTSQKYFVGDTPVHYRTACGGGSCTTTFTAQGDGFWDVAVGDFDGPGPRGEVPGGTPYPFLRFSWQMTFTDPRTRP